MDDFDPPGPETPEAAETLGAPARPLLDPGARLALAAGVTAALVVAAGWFTGIRLVLHGVLLALLVAAFLPVLVVLAGLTLALLVAVLAGLTGGGGGAEAGGLVAEGGARLFRPYYRFLARQRHPLLLGAVLGALLGGLLLWAGLAGLVLPGEARTAQVLAQAKQRLDEEQRRTGRLPGPGAADTLSLGEGVVRDGFGRPLRYTVSGMGRLGSYRLLSLGHDGVPGADDLCVSGGSRLRTLLDDTALLIHDLARPGGEWSATRLSGVAALRCPP